MWQHMFCVSVMRAVWRLTNFTTDRYLRQAFSFTA